MNNSPASRRSFLKKSTTLGIAAPFIMSVEEYVLKAQGAEKDTDAKVSPPVGNMPNGKIGSVQIGRLICGGNLISGYAHSRDLIYVSPLLRHYFTDEKIMETWALCEQHGVNTMIFYPADPRAAAVYERYRAKGGKMQYLAQINPSKTDLKTSVKQAKDAGAVGAFLLGNLSDAWTREGDTKKIVGLMSLIKDHGMISGVAGHELRTIKAVEEAGGKPDFYMKTLHEKGYWSAQRPDQMKEVIDNYSIDNYWCQDPKETIAYMSELDRPWIAYKVLAAGAIHPKAGFRHAFENGADFAAVGMFDFQIAENATIAAETVKAAQSRQRAWCA